MPPLRLFHPTTTQQRLFHRLHRKTKIEQLGNIKSCMKLNKTFTEMFKFVNKNKLNDCCFQINDKFSRIEDGRKNYKIFNKDP